MAVVVLRTIDQLNDIVDLAVDRGPKQVRFRAVFQVVGQLFEQAGGGIA